MNFSKYLLILSLMGAASLSISQPSESPDAAEESTEAVVEESIEVAEETSTLPDATEIDEIVTTGQRSTWAQKFQIIEAEDSVFEVFNEVFSGTDYEMKCNPTAVLRDEFTQNRPSPLNRWCVTSYVEEHEQVAIQEMLELGYSPTLDFLDTTIQEHNNELRVKLVELYQENPEFRKRVEEYAVLKRKADASAEANGEEKSGGFLSRMFGGRN